MDSAITLVLLGLLSAFVGDAAASCRQVPNDEMTEYLCEGGHPADLASIPQNAEKLRIIRMPLHRITADTFSRFNGNLLVLSCSHCEIADIDADAFRRLDNLQQLSLDNGRLSIVRAMWFEGLSQLTYLDLTYNEIREIEDDVYKHLPHLVDLRISGNKLQCLNLEAMSHLKTLKRIFLSENPDFACPHAVSKFLENQGVSFEPDPEWRRLVSDTIDVPVPPSHAEQDHKVLPQVPGVRPGNARFYPDLEDYAGYHRSRHRKPTRPTTTPTPSMPRVEPVDIRAQTPPSNQMVPYPYSPHTTHETVAATSQPRYPELPPEVSSHQIVSHQYTTHETVAATSQPRYPEISPEVSSHRIVSHQYSPHSTHETVPSTSGYPGYPEISPEVSSHRIVSHPYSPHSTHETVPSTSGYPGYPETSAEPSSHHQRIPYPYSTAETSRVPFTEPRPSEDVRLAGTDRSSQIPPGVSYPTTGRPQLPMEAASREDKTTADYGTPSRPENVVTYPLHALTPVSREDGEKTSDDGYLQITRLPYDVHGAIASTEDAIDVEHAEISSRMRDGGRQGGYPPRPTPDGNDRSQSTWSTNVAHETPHHAEQDLPRKLIVDKTSINDYSNSVDRVKPDQSQATVTASNVHYVRPSPSELMHSPATTSDVFYQAPYYETSATLHPPLQNYPDKSTVYIYPTEVSTSLPECKNSAPGTRPAAVLVMSIIITIFGHVIVEGF